MWSPLHRAGDLLRDARQVMVLTGAGISAESGIAPFRGSRGIWSRYDPMEYGTAEALQRDPGKVWRMLYDLGLEIAAAAPNKGHEALARWERHGRTRIAIVTQNVDGLHQRGGSTEVIQLHGSSRELSCMRCGARTPASGVAIAPDKLPPRCACGGVLRPDVVLFGELLPEAAWQRASRAAREADALLVVGTSAEVAPASTLPAIGKRSGAPLVEVNPERTWLSDELTDVLLQGPAGGILPELVDNLLS